MAVNLEVIVRAVDRASREISNIVRQLNNVAKVQANLANQQRQEPQANRRVLEAVRAQQRARLAILRTRVNSAQMIRTEIDRQRRIIFSLQEQRAVAGRLTGAQRARLEATQLFVRELNQVLNVQGQINAVTRRSISEQQRQSRQRASDARKIFREQLSQIRRLKKEQALRHRDQIRQNKELESRVKKFTQVAQQSLFRAFTGQGGLFGLSLRLFAPLGGIRRGAIDITRGISRVFGSLSSGFQAPIVALEGIADAIQGVSGALGGVIAQFGLLAGAPIRIFGGLLGLIPQIGQGFVALGAIIGGIAESIFGLAGELSRVFGEVLGGLVRLTGTVLKPIVGAFQELISPITTVFGVIRFAWRFSLLGMAAATTLFVKSSISSFLDLSSQIEEAIGQLSIRTSQQAEQAFGQIADAARSVSKDIGVSMEEVATSLTQALSVGFKLGDQFKGTREDALALATAAAKMAAVGKTDVADTTLGLTQIMNSFGKQVSDVSEVADVLTAVFQVGGGRLRFFAEGFGKVSSEIAAQGGTFRDVAEAAALLSGAAQGQKAIFTELARGFSSLISNADELGIVLARTASGGIDLFGTLDNVREVVNRFGGADTVEGGRILQALFPERRARRGFARLLAQLPDRIREVRERIAGSGGLLGELFEAGQGLPDRSRRRLIAAFGALRNQIGRAISPGIGRAVDFLTDAFNRIEDTVNRIRKSAGFDALFKSISDLGGKLGLGSPEELFGQMQLAVEFLIQEGLPKASNLFTAIVSKAQELVSIIRDLTANIIPSFNLEGITSAIESFSFDEFIANALDAFSVLANSAVRVFDSILDVALKTFFGIGRIVEKFVTPIISALEVLSPGLAAPFKALQSAFTGAIGFGLSEEERQAISVASEAVRAQLGTSVDPNIQLGEKFREKRTKAALFGPSGVRGAIIERRGAGDITDERLGEFVSKSKEAAAIEDFGDRIAALKELENLIRTETRQLQNLRGVMRNLADEQEKNEDEIEKIRSRISQLEGRPAGAAL